MSNKTNKSYSKRIRRTRTGKLLTRRPGQNHFNAKAPRHAQLARKRSAEFAFPVSHKTMSRLMPN